MKEEILSLETAQKLADYENMEKELKLANEKAHYYKSEWENVTRLCVSKSRELTTLRKENTKLRKELEGK